ncbi:MAG: urease accessory protein [Oleiphilaceae bacterium]|jgi:urease accessory protein
MVSDAIALARLLQLSSVSLPVGGYAFSQGLEYAIECGWIKNNDDVEQWIQLQLKENLARVDLPILKGVMDSSLASDWSRFRHLNDLVIASRETKELRLTDTAMGEALYRLLKSLDFTFPFLLPFKAGDIRFKQDELSFVSLFAYAAQCWGIPYKEAATGFTWSWLENQVAAATKLVPLGQTQAQRLLTLFQPAIAQTIERAALTIEENIGGGLPALAIASALHETQYSRLFRS